MRGSVETGRMRQLRVQRKPRANPDDPPVQRLPQGPHGPRPGPNYLGIPGRTAIVQGQVFLVAVTGERPGLCPRPGRDVLAAPPY